MSLTPFLGYLIGLRNHLHAFLQTAERGSLSAAAQYMGVTQSTLSRQVSALEVELGVTLFERVGRSVVVAKRFRAAGYAHHGGSRPRPLAATGTSNSGRCGFSHRYRYRGGVFVAQTIQRISEAAHGVTIEVIAAGCESVIYDSVRPILRFDMYALKSLNSLRACCAMPARIFTHRPIGSRKMDTHVRLRFYVLLGLVTCGNYLALLQNCGPGRPSHTSVFWPKIPWRRGKWCAKAWALG